MSTLFYVLPLIFAAMGWTTTYVEFYAMGGAFAFYMAYTIISEGKPLTNSEVFMSIIYAVLAISLMLRIITETGGRKK